MLENTIEVSYNHDDDDGSTAALVISYDRFMTYLNRSEYHSSEHTNSMRDILNFYRSPIKSSGNFRGTCKTAMKLTVDQVVPGVDVETSLIRPAIIEIGSSMPIGMTDAQVVALCMRASALFANSVVRNALTINQSI